MVRDVNLQPYVYCMVCVWYVHGMCMVWNVHLERLRCILDPFTEEEQRPFAQKLENYSLALGFQRLPHNDKVRLRWSRDMVVT